MENRVDEILEEAVRAQMLNRLGTTLESSATTNMGDKKKEK